MSDLIDTSVLQTELAKMREREQAALAALVQTVGGLAARIEALEAASPPAPEPAPAPLPLPIPAGTIVLDGGEVELESGKTYTGWANRVYASRLRDTRLVDLDLMARGMDDAVRLVGRIERVTIERVQISGARVGIDIEARASEDFARDVTIRDCTIRDANTAGLGGHSQGVYFYGVDGFEISGNTIDGCGRPITKYNHGLYISHSNNGSIAGNTIRDSSSFAVKLRSDETGGMQHVVVEDNTVTGGANGITVGGDQSPRFAFADLMIRNNTFTDLGRNIGGNPQSIGLDLASCDGAEVSGNRFEGKALATPHAAIRVRDLPQHGVRLAGNTFRGWPKTLSIEAASGVTVEGAQE